MEKINQFSFNRFILLIKRYLIFNIKTLLIGLAAGSGVMIVVSLLQAYFSTGYFNVNALVTTGHTFIFVGGYILTSMAYNEIHTPARSQFYLTLPATAAEKLFSNWFITSIIYVIVTNLVLWLVLLLSNSIAHIAWSTPWDIFNPFAPSNTRLMAIYMATQGIFFLGALYFRKNNFMKTILSLFVISMIINLITVAFAYLIFGTPGLYTDMEAMDPDFGYNFITIMPKVMKGLLYWVLAPFCLVVSYFTLKEREV